MLMLSMMLFAKTPVTAENSTTISVINPQAEGNFIFYTNTTSIGHKFNVTLWVYNVTDLFAYQVYQTYDYTLLNATRAWFPIWDTQWVFYGRETTFLPPPVFGPHNASHDYVQIGGVLVVGTTFSGPGILSVIEFEILEAPSILSKVFDNLAIDNDDTYLLDSGLVDIPAARVNGYYEYVWLEPGLEVKPSKYVAVAELETFDIAVWLNNVTTSDRLVSLEFKLRYNATLLNVTQVTEGSFLAGFGNTNFNYVDDKVENLSITNHLNPPYDTNFPEGNGTIATITFQGIYQDFNKNLSCPLELIDINFVNDTGNPITPITPSINGSYTILRDRSSYITINVAPDSVLIGSNVTISGTIKPSKVGVNVTIYFKLAPQSWANLTTVQTGSESNYTYIWKPTNWGTYELKANWTGDATPTYPAESDIATLTVKRLASIITIHVNPTMVTVGANVTISGAINVTLASVNVTIYLRLEDGAWSALSTIQNSSSYYTYVWATTEGGSYELYARWLGDNVTLGAESSKAAVTVKKVPSAITVNVNPTTVMVGDNVTINGAINVTNKVSVNVTIYYRLNTTGEWIALATVKTDATSNYNYTWKATKKTLNETDTFQFFAGWLGDGTTSGANSLTIGWLTVRQLPSTITVDINPKNVQAGSNVSINGTITPAKTQASVIIYYRLAGGLWNTLATVKTDSNSVYSYDWTTTKKTLNSSETFELKASWSGDVATKRAESNVETVTVEKIQSTITINVDSSTVTIGSNATITGAITPTKANVDITIYYREKGTTAQLSLSAKTNSEGHYNYTWRPMKNATFELYAWWGEDENTYSNESDIVTLKVNLIKINITIGVYPEATTVGSNITISGTINPNKPGVEVSIYYRPKAANQSWIQLGTTTIGSNGNYTYTWTTTQAGEYELETRWPGDNLTEPAKSQTKIVKVEEPFSLVTYVPYILGGAAIIIIALAFVYLTKIKKH